MNKILAKKLMLMYLGIFLSSCIGMPISSIYRLSKLNPLEVNPAVISIVVIAPKLLRLKNGSVTLKISFTSEQEANNFESVSEASIQSNAPISELITKTRPDESITVFYLDKDSANTMAASQARIKDLRQRRVKGDVNLSIDITNGCISGPKPKSLSASIYLKLDQEQGYIMMNSNLDLLELTTQKDRQDFWVQCVRDPIVASTTISLH